MTHGWAKEVAGRLLFGICLPGVSTLSESRLVFREYVSSLVPLPFCWRSSIRLDGICCPVTDARWEKALTVEVVLPVQDVVWSVASTDRCSLADAVAYMHPSKSNNPAFLALHPLRRRGRCIRCWLWCRGQLRLIVYAVIQWSYVHSSLQVDSTVIPDRWIEYSVETAAMANVVFNIVHAPWTPLGRDKSYWRVEGFYGAIRSVEAHIHSF